MSYSTIEEIKHANAASGGHWFAPDTMRFFGSRISHEIIGGCLFVSSELDFDGGQRWYTLRRARPDGGIETIGNLQQYASLEAAKRAARRMASAPDGSEADVAGRGSADHARAT